MCSAPLLIRDIRAPSDAFRRIWIPGIIPTQNDLLDAQHRRALKATRGHRIPSEYARIKRHWAEMIGLIVLASGPRVRPVPAAITFVHAQLNRLYDPDNVCGGASKVVLDGLVKAHVLANDGWRDVLDLRHHWAVDPHPGVLILLGPRVFERSELGL